MATRTNPDITIKIPNPNEYNGWRNYETWCVNLWLSNEQPLYERCRDIASECKHNAPKHRNALPSGKNAPVWSVGQTARYTTADAIKVLVDEMRPDLGNNMFSDLMTSALADVDWSEVADAFLED